MNILNLVHYILPPSANTNDNLCEQFHFLEKFDGDIVILNYNKTSQNMETILKKSLFSTPQRVYNLSLPLNTNDFMSWDSFMKSVISSLKTNFSDYDNYRLFLFGGIQRASFKNFNKVDEIKDSFKYVDFIIKRNSTYSLLLPIYLNEFLGDELVEKYQIVFDPLDLNHKEIIPDLELLHPINIKKRGIRYDKNLVQDFLLNKGGRINKTYNKELDFTVGFSIVLKERKYLREFYDKYLKNLSNSKIFIRDKISKPYIKTIINREEYLKYIGKSLHTIIFPTYCPHSFSIIRLLESVFYGCVPFIHNDCNVSGLFDTYENLDKDLINSLIIKDPADLKPLSPQEHREILDHLYSALFLLN